MVQEHSIASELDIHERASDHTTDVATSSTLIMASEPARTSAEFINDSDVVIYLAQGHDAVLNRGIRLNASGGWYEINLNNLFRGPVYAIHGGAGTKVLCAEQVRSRHAR